VADDAAEANCGLDGMQDGSLVERADIARNRRGSNGGAAAALRERSTDASAFSRY